jgi:GT2 family glycosyltransferase
MIIQILSNLFEEGYMRKYSLLSPFFAGANVAFRSQALSQAGLYDVNCHSGEDQDMCLRIAKAGWELYFEPKAIVRHKNAMTLRTFVRKWFDYGFHHPYIFKKHSSRSLKVYRTRKRSEEGYIYRCLLSMRFPFHISIFLTSFLAMHILLALSILFVIISLYIPAIIGGLVTLTVAASYFKADISGKSILQTGVFIFLRYATNLALLLGAFSGGAKLGMLYISATLNYTS